MQQKATQGGGGGGGSSVAKAALWYGHLSKELLRMALKMSPCLDGTTFCFLSSAVMDLTLLRDCATDATRHGCSAHALFYCPLLPDSLKPREPAEHANGG